MNSVDMDNEELSDDEDDEDYIPDEEEYNEGLNDKDDSIIRDYDDDENIQDEEDDYEPVGSDTTDVNDDNNLGCLIGSPGEVMAAENPGVEDIENLGVEHEDHDDRIPSTTPGADPPRDARDSGSARSHSTHLETISSDRP